jgi:hypothetical protein
MRLDANHPPADLRYAAARIFLNDVEIRNVVVADEEAGQVVRVRTDAAWCCIVNGERFALETLTGRVRIDA